MTPYIDGLICQATYRYDYRMIPKPNMSLPPVDWKALLKAQESAIFLLGSAFAVAIVAWCFIAGSHAAGKAAAIVGVVSAHLTGGRASGVAMAVGSQQFDRWEIIVLGSLIEGTVVCLFFSAFCLSCKKLIQVPWLQDAMRNVHESAENQRPRLLKWGIPGLILFVWFPFLMTGPVVGSVIGFLLGMRPWVTVAIVMFGTISAIVSWTFIMDQLETVAQRIGNVAPMVFVVLLITVVVAYRYKRYREAQTAKRAAQQRLERPPMPSSADETPPEKRRPR